MRIIRFSVMDVTYSSMTGHVLFHTSFSSSVFSSLLFSEQPQPLKGLHAGGVDCYRYGWLLVCLHPEPLLQRSHEEDDERPGRLTEGWAEPPWPPAKVRVYFIFCYTRGLLLLLLLQLMPTEVFLSFFLFHGWLAELFPLSSKWIFLWWLVSVNVVKWTRLAPLYIR